MNLQLPADSPERSSSTSTRSIVAVCLWLTVLFFVTSALLIKAVPNFERVFKNFDAELPKLTQWLINVSNWYLGNWYIVALGWLGAMFACGMLCKTNCRREAHLIRNVLAVAVLILLLFAAVALFLPYKALLDKIG